MKKEKSCGAIVYKLENKKIMFLIIKGLAGHHYTFPKGHMEGVETESETAKREIKEETNVDVELDCDFREVIGYHPIESVYKDVVYFVGRAIEPVKTKPQAEEIEEIFWCSYEDAMKIISFDNQKQVLMDANNYLLNCLK